MAVDKRLLRAIERERRIRGEDVFGQPTITLLHPKYAKGRSPDDALDDLEAAHAEEFQPTGVPSAPGESPEGTTPQQGGAHRHFVSVCLSNTTEASDLRPFPNL